MSLENNIKGIKDFLIKRYGNNLAGILIFGSVNTGHFLDGKSDIDHMIFLKKLNGLNIEEELKVLNERLKRKSFASQYFNDLEGLKDYIKKRKSFSTYIVLVGEGGSRTVYTTPEFEKTREYLREHPLTRKEIQEGILEKDKFELDGYFKDIKEYGLAKQLMFHLRRKLQVVNYFLTKRLIFDYHVCLDNVNVDKEEKERLEKLYKAYEKKRGLSEREIDYYMNLAREFTKRVIQS